MSFFFIYHYLTAFILCKLAFWFCRYFTCLSYLLGFPLMPGLKLLAETPHLVSIAAWLTTVHGYDKNETNF